MQTKLLWARREPFNALSRDQVLAYGLFKKYPIPKNRKTKKPTVDDEALEKLSLRFPEDTILSGVRLCRAVSKARGYLKGTYLGRDDRLHPQYINLPETGRLSSKAPSIMNQPQGRDQAKAELAKEVRNTIVASPGFRLGETDWRAIEALLVGYFGEDPAYMRLARLGVHDFLSCHVIIKQPTQWAIIKELGPQPEKEGLSLKEYHSALEEWEAASETLRKVVEWFKQEPPSLEMEDEKLKSYFRKVKKLFPKVRYSCKTVVHGCLTGDHEILTPDGWVRIDEWTPEKKIAVWRQDGSLSFEKPLKYHVYDHDGPLTKLDGTSIQAVVTEDHKFPVRQDSGGVVSWKSVQVKDFGKSGRIPLTGVLSTQKSGLHLKDNDIRLAVALQADGCITPAGAIKFHLRKERKINRIEALLKIGAFEYQRADYDSPSGISTVFTVKSGGFYGPLALFRGGQDKTFDLSVLLRLPQEKRLTFLDELSHWDGDERHYRTTNKANVEAVQTIAHVSGWEALVREAPKEEQGNRKLCYVLSFNEREYAWVDSINRESVPFQGKVYCFSVTSTYFLVRYGGSVFVSGNSNYLAGIPTIARNLECSYKEAETLVAIYRDALPGIKAYQTKTLLMAHNERKMTCPFGCPSPYWFQVGEPLPDGTWKMGKQANEAAAWRPQHTCSCLLREVLVLLEEYDGDDFHLLAPIHDSIFWEAREEKFDHYKGVVSGIMERPWDELGGLSVETETKSGMRWSQME